MINWIIRFVRSTVFNILFYILSTLICFFGLVVLPFKIVIAFVTNSDVISLTRNFAFYICRLWGKMTLELAARICNIMYIVEGVENLPKSPFIIASKHSSVWEIAFFFAYFEDVTFVLKKEVIGIPIVGVYPIIAGMIVVDRKNGFRSMINLDVGINNAISKNKVCVIFPEGTRVMPEEIVEYKSGIALIYQKYHDIAPIIPTGTNSGYFWPRNSWMRNSGLIFIRFMPPLDKGKSKSEVIKDLEKIVNDNSRDR